jgi:hypothetical protein
MSTYLNVCFRLLASAAAGIVAGIYIPGITSAGAFTLGQAAMYLSLCVVPLPWRRLVMCSELQQAEARALAMKSTGTCQQNPAFDGKCALYSGIYSGTPAENVIKLQFAGKVADRRASRIQENVQKASFFVFLGCPALIIAAYFINKLQLAPAPTSTLDSRMIVAFLQIVVSLIAASCAGAFWYGEVEAQREVTRAAL